jgi:hypothetical protein
MILPDEDRVIAFVTDFVVYRVESIDILDVIPPKTRGCSDFIEQQTSWNVSLFRGPSNLLVCCKLPSDVDHLGNGFNHASG